jgi:hypothetical protein
MDENIKEKWVNALRSGEYKQGRARLQCHDEYCCLGVLVDVAAPERWADHSAQGILDRSLRTQFGITDEWHLCLTRMNDGGMTFKQIADYIESNL